MRVIDRVGNDTVHLAKMCANAIVLELAGGKIDGPPSRIQPTFSVRATIEERPCRVGSGLDRRARFVLQLDDTADGVRFFSRGSCEVDLWSSPTGHHIATVRSGLPAWGDVSAREVIRALRNMEFIDHIEHLGPHQRGSRAHAAPDTAIRMREVEPRTMGIENEYGIRMRVDGTFLSGHDAARHLLDPMVEQDVRACLDETARPSRQRDNWRSNGARIYPDVDQPEAATPECTDLLDLVAYDAAGDRMLAGTVAAIRRQQDSGISVEVYKVSARNWISGTRRLDVLDASWGSHENLLVDTTMPLARLEWEVVPLLAARPILVGTGGFNPRGDDYRVSLRSEAVGHILRESAQGSRPFVMVRGEPHASAQYRRLQIVSADATPSQHSTLLRMAMTHLTLKQIESGLVGFAGLALANPTKALQAVGKDPTGAVRIALADGRKVGAIDILEMYLDKAERFGELGRMGTIAPLRADELLAIDLWRRSVDDLRNDLADGGSRTSDRIDWVLKRDVLRRAADRGATPFRLRQIDTNYHDVNDGIAARFQRSGRLMQVVDEQRLQHAMVHPPQTRAAIRSKLLEVTGRLDCELGLNWTEIRVDIPQGLRKHGVAQRKFVLSDPVKHFNAEVDEFVSTLEARAAERRWPGGGDDAA